MKKIIGRLAPVLKFRFTAYFFMRNLALKLYKDYSACLWEIVRNAVCACMPDERVWTPGVGDVEIFLVEHPITPGTKSLIVLDHGRGFTPDDIERFCFVGASMEDIRKNPEGGHNHQSENRQGRFAALALNAKCSVEQDPNYGFYVFTRTAEETQVRLISVIPAIIEKIQGSPHEELSLQDPKLGFLNEVKGSFTAIVIPYSVFSSYEDIRRALKWRLPRKPEQAFKLVIGGKKLEPPPLASEVNFMSEVMSEDGSVEAHIDPAAETDEEGGIWLTDLDTGLRIVKTRQIAFNIPTPFESNRIVGDVFVRGVTLYQDVSRTGLVPSCFKTETWRKITRCLVANSWQVKALLGEEDGASKTPFSESLGEIMSMFHKTWGKPDRVLITGDGPVEILPETKKKPIVGGFTKVVGPTKPKPEDDDPKPTVEKKDKPPRFRKWSALRIGDRTYVLRTQQMDSRTFASIEPGVDYDILTLNMRGYEGFPQRREAREEHMLMQMLLAVGKHEHPDQIDSVMRRAVALRMELLGRK